MRRRVLVSSLLLASTVAPVALRAQDAAASALEESTPQHLRTLAPEEPFLDRIRAAAFRGGALAVLSSPEPAVFLFEADRLTTWGDQGHGPSELMNPGDVAWIGDQLLVWDFDLVKIATYDTEGVLKATRRFAGAPVGHMSVSAGDTLISLFSYGGGARAVVRLRGAEQDTIVLLPPVAEQITLRAEGSPSLTLAPPFAPTATWASLPTGGVVFWDGQSPYLQRVDLTGKIVDSLTLPRDRFSVTPQDRAAWVGRAIPSQDIAGRGDIFRSLRSSAEDQVVFPSEFPPVLELIGDPRGGVWVRRTPPARGEVWTYVDELGPQVTLRFPARYEVLAVSAAEIAVKAVDALDVESVEVYRNPRGSQY